MIVFSRIYWSRADITASEVHYLDQKAALSFQHRPIAESALSVRITA